MDPILMYLTTESLPIEKFKARRVKFQAKRYHVIHRVLYKRGYTLLYLRCIYSNQVKGIMQEIHEGVL